MSLLNSMISRRSIRQFDTSKPVPADVLDSILLAMRQAPITIGAQMASVIVVQDKAAREFLMEQSRGAGGLQPHIAEAPVFLIFLIDFYKVNRGMELTGTKLGVQENVNGLLAGATDAALIMGTASAAAEALGLATVCIGSIRNNDLQPLIDYFKLPPLTFPLCGMCLGYATPEGEKTQPKPRLPMEFFAHGEHYRTDIYANLPKVMADYDEALGRWKGGPMRWMDYPNAAYQAARHEHVIKNLNSQGFHF